MKRVPFGDLFVCTVTRSTRGLTRNRQESSLLAFFVYPYGTKGFATTRTTSPALSGSEPRG
jgi:hypothetical protein